MQHPKRSRFHRVTLSQRLIARTIPIAAAVLEKVVEITFLGSLFGFLWHSGLIQRF